MFVLFRHLSGVDVVLVDVLVVVVNVDVDVVEVDDEVVEELVLDDVLEVVDVLDDVVVVVSHSLQVLSQCVTLATRLLHKPCSLKAMHCLVDNVLILPSHLSIGPLLIGEKGTDMVVDVDVVVVVVSHRLQVLSQPPGAIRVSHKPFAKIAWHSESSNVFNLPLQRSVVVVVVLVLVVVVIVLVVEELEEVDVVDVMVLVLVVVEDVVVLLVDVVNVDVVDVLVVVVVVSQPLHVLSH